MNGFSRQTWRRLSRRGGARLGAGIVALVLLVAAAADFLASDRPLAARFQGELYWLPALSDPPALRPLTFADLEAQLGPDDWLVRPLIAWGPNAQDKTSQPLAAPSPRHWLGTDGSRRDVLARLIHGTRVSLLVGVVAVAIYLVIGTLLGLVAGYVGGLVDSVISRTAEAVMTIPVFFLILAVMGVMEQAGIGTMMVVIGLVYWTHIARLVRAETLRVRAFPFVEAAVALGYSTPRILLRHILPNVSGPILVAATFGVASTILVEASLSFLGFGTPDATASWGGLLRGAMGNFHAWWLAAFPGTAIFVTVMAYNLLGEALRDALDPRDPS